MLAGKQVTSFRILSWIGYSLFLLAVSCTVPKRYQPYKPFVFQSNINVEDKTLRTDAKKELKDKLQNQLDDSLKVRTVLCHSVETPFFLQPAC